MKKTFWKFVHNPLSIIKRVIYKNTVEKIKYSKGNDYNADRYWSDRLSRHGFSLRGVGDEGLSEEKNKENYINNSRLLISICKKEKLIFKNLKVLDIGCGTGFYAQLLSNLGTIAYTGIDITDVLFLKLKRKFPKFQFIRKDITTERINGKFDLVLMIDVIEHIVTESKFSYAMHNIKSCLSQNGVFIVTPVANKTKRHFFYLKSWSLGDFIKEFSGYNFNLFKNGMLSIKK